MTTTEKTTITVEATVKAPVEKVWTAWTEPNHVTAWNNASPDWHTPRAGNDLREGGRFSYRMESRDGSMGFDFAGTYKTIVPHREISFVMDDDRKVTVLFTPQGNETHVTETFEAESTHSEEMQRAGWQAIMDNFKAYTESLGTISKMHFEELINAPVENVYRIMLNDETYRQWTSAFNASSFYRGSWEKGATIHFIGSDKDGNEGGMVSRIKENIPNRFLSIEHLGILQNGKEITTGPEVEGWAGALENYTFTPEGERTRVSVDMDATKEWQAYFSETWPKALAKLKAICEN